MLGLNMCATIAQLLGKILNITSILESGVRNFKTEGYSILEGKAWGFCLFCVSVLDLWKDFGRSTELLYIFQLCSRFSHHLHLALVASICYRDEPVATHHY